MEWNPRRTIVLVGTLDTKGEEILFLKRQLAQAGAETVVIDVGALGPPLFAPDVACDEIASGVKNLHDRGSAIAAMESGFAGWCRERRAEIAGILAIGGSAGTTIATAGMRELPVGVPKLMVSTMASGDTRPYVGSSDIAMMYAVGDFTGLNRLTRSVLTNAANAMAGMCCLPLPAAMGRDRRPLLAATMFGVTTPCVNRVRQLLDAKGFEVLVFHATGSGGRAMEQLVRDGFIAGVLDITTTELADELAGGVLSAGPDRMEAAGALGVPQVISVGALDMVNFGTRDSVPERYAARKLYQHNPTVTLMRTTAEECSKLGEMIAQKANLAKGPVAIALPLRGVSAIDREGHPFDDPDADQALFDGIRRCARVRIVEVDAHINDPEFADRLAEEMVSLLAGAGGPDRIRSRHAPKST